MSTISCQIRGPVSNPNGDKGRHSFETGVFVVKLSSPKPETPRQRGRLADE